MFDIKWIRDNAGAFDAAMKRRGKESEFSAAALIALDDKRRALLTSLQDAQGRRNAASKEIGKAKGAKDEATASKLMAEVAALKDTIAKGEDDERRIDAEIRDALAVIPNLPREEVPLGKDEHDNKEVRRVGTPKKFDFEPKQHFDLGEALGLMDFEGAQKISGARFVVLKGALARLERAIAAFMLDLHTAPVNGRLSGYTEHNPPLLVKDQAAYGTGNLPKFAEDLFKTTNEYWLIPTAEVPLTNLVRESILEESQLPVRMTSWTPCFRSYAGASDNGFACAQVLPRFDTRAFVDNGDAGVGIDAANPVQSSGIEAGLGLMAQQRLEGNTALWRAEMQSVSRRGVCDVIGHHKTPGSGHVPNEDSGFARDVFGEMASDHARIGVVPAAGRKGRTR